MLTRITSAVSTTIISIFIVGLSLLVILSLVGCADKAPVVYKTKEVNVAVRCNIPLPPLVEVPVDAVADTKVTELMKSYEIHRKALLCCIKGKCDL